MLEDLDSFAAVEEYIVISNHRFADHFRSWAREHSQRITVLDDGTETNETRLGAVRDIQFAVETLGLHEDVLVAAGDNLLDFSLRDFLEFQKEKAASCVLCYRETDYERLKKAGVAELNEKGRIVGMQEKPAEPRSQWCTPPFYVYTGEDLALVKSAIAEGCGTDAPGSFLAWLSGKKPVYAWQMPGRRYDIGDLKTYQRVQNEFKGILK